MMARCINHYWNTPKINSYDDFSSENFPDDDKIDTCSYVKIMNINIQKHVFSIALRYYNL